MLCRAGGRGLAGGGQVVQTRSNLLWRSGAPGEGVEVAVGKGKLPVHLSSPVYEALSSINRSPWSSAAVKGL